METMRSPRIGCIFLNYNNTDDTLGAVESLLRTQYEPLDVLVVDNGSDERWLSKLRHGLAGTNVQILEMGRNLGFTGGNNAGYRVLLQQHPDYILLLNNDTYVEPNFLGPLVEALEGDPGAAAASGLICYFPETERIWYAGGRFVPWRATGIVDDLDHNVASVPDRGLSEVTFVSGCLSLVRASALSPEAIYDDRFFLYVDDTELSTRLIRQGFRLLYVPSSRIYHKTIHRNETARPLYYTVRNRLLLTRIVMSGPQAIVARMYVLITTLLKCVTWRISQPLLARAAWWGIVDFYRNRLCEGRGMQLPRSKPAS